ncbi:MAG: ATP-binding cassette domain-containing protein, partial [Solirubrobacteraceae bacterium]
MAAPTERSKQTMDSTRQRDPNPSATKEDNELTDGAAKSVDLETGRPQKADDRVTSVAKRIEVSDLDLYYGSFHAVSSVSMTIQPNKVTALIGSSGCGKSTFLRSLNRMHELVPGARVDGQVVIDG